MWSVILGTKRGMLMPKTQASIYATKWQSECGGLMESYYFIMFRLKYLVFYYDSEAEQFLSTMRVHKWAKASQSNCS